MATCITCSNLFDTEFPYFWDQHTKEDGAVKCVLLSPSSNEYNSIAVLFKQTLPRCHIERIERIQNKLLWQKYMDCARRMIQYNNGCLGKATLFHGTSFNDPKLIYEGDSSFDMRYSQNGLWGQGNYFAANASYSDVYSHQVPCFDLHQMLVAYVLTGFTYHSSPQKFCQPPFRPAKYEGIKYRYDSVSGVAAGSKVIITYENDRAYPAYLITYKGQ